MQKFDISQTSPALLYMGIESGNDTIVGSKEADVMFSTAGNDKLTGLNGDDTLVASGKATMTGDHGSDTFVFSGLTK